MKRLKISAGLLGVVLAKKFLVFHILALNFLENLLNLHLGSYSGFTVENILLSIAFGLVLYYLVEKR